MGVCELWVFCFVHQNGGGQTIQIVDILCDNTMLARWQTMRFGCWTATFSLGALKRPLWWCFWLVGWWVEWWWWWYWCWSLWRDGACRMFLALRASTYAWFVRAPPRWCKHNHHQHIQRTECVEVLQHCALSTKSKSKPKPNQTNLPKAPVHVFVY